MDLDGGFCTGRAVLDLDGRLCTWTRFWTPTVVFERGGGGVDVCSIIFFLWFVFVSFNSLGLYSLFNKNADRVKFQKHSSDDSLAWRKFILSVFFLIMIGCVF